LLDTLTRGLESVAEVEPWTAVFDPGTTTLGRLLELTREVDFAAFIFGQDDWTAVDANAPADGAAGVASPRDNVVFEAGLFGGVLGMRRTFILHAHGAKLPTDLLGLTCVRYADPLTPAERKRICQVLRDAIESDWRPTGIEGLWWQFSLTERSEREPSAISLLRVARGRDGALEMNGRSWREDGKLSARYRSAAAKEQRDPPGIFYYWTGERPLESAAPLLSGTGKIELESADRATGYWITVVDQAGINERTSGIYLRADASDLEVLDGSDDRRRAELIADRLASWARLRNG
jgi:hypothetical protein